MHRGFFLPVPLAEARLFRWRSAAQLLGLEGVGSLGCCLGLDSLGQELEGQEEQQGKQKQEQEG